MSGLVSRLREEAQTWWIEAGSSEGKWASDIRVLARLLDDAAAEIELLQNEAS